MWPSVPFGPAASSVLLCELFIDPSCDRHRREILRSVDTLVISTINRGFFDAQLRALRHLIYRYPQVNSDLRTFLTPCSHSKFRWELSKFAQDPFTSGVGQRAAARVPGKCRSRSKKWDRDSERRRAMSSGWAAAPPSPQRVSPPPRVARGAQTLEMSSLTSKIALSYGHSTTTYGSPSLDGQTSDSIPERYR